MPAFLRVVALSLTLSLLSLLALSSEAVPARTLVVLASVALRSRLSAFLSDLQASNHELSFAVSGPGVSPFEFGERMYDNLILFGSSYSDLPIDSLQDFVDAGGNILVAADSDKAGTIRKLSNRCGFNFEASSKLADSVNKMSSGSDDTVFQTRNWIRNPYIVNGSVSSSVVFKGVAQTALAKPGIPILSGMTSTYVRNGDKVNSEPIAEDCHLVIGAQSHNNARVVIAGSVDMFSDAFISMFTDGKESGNREFAKSVALWTFRQRGIIRARNIRHFLAGGSGEMPTQYTIKDVISHEFDIDIYDIDQKSWVPYEADDVQLELIMMDPYVRKNIQQSKGHYSTTLMVPDVCGVYKLAVHYERQGLTALRFDTIVGIRPFRHDEFERFIPAALPYYSSALLMMIMFFLFNIVYLYHQDEDKSN